MKPDLGPIKGLTRVLGVDVAKGSVVIFDSVSARSWSAPNQPRALRQALAPYADYELMVCEVTGGYERALLAVALDLGLPAHRADPLRVKRYIASLGGAAKTDGIDAAWLARYGRERGADLARWRAGDADGDTLASLVRHRRRLVEARAKARTRRGGPAAQPLASLLKAEIDFLARQIAKLDRAIDQLMDRTPHLARREAACDALSASDPSSPEASAPSRPRSEPSTAARPPPSPAGRPIPETPA